MHFKQLFGFICKISWLTLFRLLVHKMLKCSLNLIVRGDRRAIFKIGNWLSKYLQFNFQNQHWKINKTKLPGAVPHQIGLFWARRLACAMRSLAIVITIVQSFSPSSFLYLFSPSFAFVPLRGSSRVGNNCCPNILA